MSNTGTTMDAILRDVTEVTTIMKQNASLVEEVSAVAAALERQTEDLQRSVQKFRLTS